MNPDRTPLRDMTERAGAVPAARQPRAIGEAHVSVTAGADGRTQLADLRQSGALKLVFPRRFGAGREAVLINTAGGITGGDALAVSADVGARAQLTITTQAAERIYRSDAGVGRVETRLRVAAGGSLRWLPQETILFERAALRRRLHVDLAAGASFLLAEPLIFGRTAMGETLSRFSLDDRIAIWRDGVPVYLDGMALGADDLGRAAGLSGAIAAAQVVLVSDQAAALLGALRGLLPPQAGVSLMGTDVLVLRILAGDGFALRQTLLPVLDRITDHHLPASWRL